MGETCSANERDHKYIHLHIKAWRDENTWETGADVDNIKFYLEVIWCEEADCQEIPHILWDPKF
jgi:hypothetical protein